MGKMQLFNLGLYLRARYGALIGDTYSNKKVYIHSSDHDRCLMSAASCLAGLFFPRDRELWHEQIQWQPIPIHSVPNDMDYLLYFGKKCPKYDIAYGNYIKNSSEFNEIYTENVKYLWFWSLKCGLNITTPLDVLKLYKTLLIENVHNKT